MGGFKAFTLIYLLFVCVVNETHVTKDVVIFGSHVTKGASLTDDQFSPRSVQRISQGLFICQFGSTSHKLN